MGRPRAAAAQNEAPGGMPEDLSRAVFCGECLPPQGGSKLFRVASERQDVILHSQMSRMAEKNMRITELKISLWDELSLRGGR